MYLCLLCTVAIPRGVILVLIRNGCSVQRRAYSETAPGTEESYRAIQIDRETETERQRVVMAVVWVGLNHLPVHGVLQV